jgi:putative nucleotidyltransferase with HDIG domain
MQNWVTPPELRVGMFVHLDMGWMSHPFPLSSFKIASVEQVAIIRGLGLKRVRWSPERSDPEPEPVLPQGQAAGSVPPPAETPEGEAQKRARALAEQQARVEAQQSAHRVCERQYAEACQDLRRVTERVGGEPAQARMAAEKLTRALLDKMLTDGDLCVRVLGEPSADRATAHAMNVAVVSLLLARTLSVPEPQLLELGTGALLHDIGKLQLPERVRLAREDFTAAEHALYRDHVLQGVQQGRRMGLSAGALQVLAQHHELADGSGFPKGLTLAEMSVASRIVALVNRYDNLCNASVPARSLTPHEALSRIFSQAREKFDAPILSGFIRLMGIYPPGSVVQLSDERFAMVMSVNAARPLKPRVLVHDAQLPSARALHLDLEQTPELSIRRSLRPLQLPPAAADYLAPRVRVAYFFDAEPVLQAQRREDAGATA